MTSPHIEYIPLAHQMPSQCTPEFIGKSSASNESPPSCGCGGSKLTVASKRRYLYTFSGSLRRNRIGLLKKIRASPILKGRGMLLVAKSFGGDGEFDGSKRDPKHRHVQSILDSVFVFSPCGNVMETHRIYEALALGAIPVIEECEGIVTNSFFPFRELIQKDIVAFVESYSYSPAAIDALQYSVMQWWHSYSAQLAENVARVALTPVAAGDKFAP